MFSGVLATLLAKITAKKLLEIFSDFCYMRLWETTSVSLNTYK